MRDEPKALQAVLEGTHHAVVAVVIMNIERHR
jgi:hypothetical protein